MKKRFMFLICTCLLGVIAHAVTYPYLTFQKADGTVVSMGVESLTMTFSDGKLLVSNGTDTHTLTVSELSSMYSFSYRKRECQVVFSNKLKL